VVGLFEAEVGFHSVWEFAYSREREQLVVFGGVIFLRITITRLT
jgi:hypothetical protein